MSRPTTRAACWASSGRYLPTPQPKSMAVAPGGQKAAIAPCTTPPQSSARLSWISPSHSSPTVSQYSTDVTPGRPRLSICGTGRFGPTVVDERRSEREDEGAADRPAELAPADPGRAGAVTGRAVPPLPGRLTWRMGRTSGTRVDVLHRAAGLDRMRNLCAHERGHSCRCRGGCGGCVGVGAWYRGWRGQVGRTHDLR
jgi:hypothetical protein